MLDAFRYDITRNAVKHFVSTKDAANTLAGAISGGNRFVGSSRDHDYLANRTMSEQAASKAP